MNSRPARTTVLLPALAALALALGLLLPAGPVAAQGAGSAGAEILRMTAGARAAALGGAYAAMPGDPDGIFYNPASVAWLQRAAGLGYEAYVEDVTIGSVSGALDAGPVVVGAGIVYLDAGEVDEIIPDPRYGGERGRSTGETVGATEAAARLAVGRVFLQGRASAGAAIGVVTSDLAGVGRTATFVDVGGQYRLGDLSLGAALRNLGGDLAHDELGDAPLPLEARVGATYRRQLAPRYGAVVSGDVVLGLEEETAGFALGAEGGLLPRDGSLVAVLRAGATLGEGDGHLGRFRVGAGIGLSGITLDYTIQTFEYLGTIHRIGIRWAR